jgi:hypothetical protein
MEEYERIVSEIYKRFGAEACEYYRFNREIPGYGRGIHAKIHHEGYIEVKRCSGKVRWYGLTEKALKVLGVSAW